MTQTPTFLDVKLENSQLKAEVEKLTDTVLKCRAEMGKRDAEITKLQGFINTQRENLGVQDAEIERLRGWEKELADMTIERDEARKDYRLCEAGRLHLKSEVKQQQAEIERLKAELAARSDLCDEYEANVKLLREEIERLRADCEAIEKRKIRYAQAAGEAREVAREILAYFANRESDVWGEITTKHPWLEE